MGALPSALKTSPRTIRQRIQIPKPSSKQAQQQQRSSPQQQQQQQQPLSQSRAEEGRSETQTQEEGKGEEETTAPAPAPAGTTSATSIPTPRPVGIEKSAPGGASTSTPHPLTSNPPTTTTTPAAPKMASDEDYAAFLEKANADPNEGYAKTQDAKKGGASLKAVDAGAQVPKGLKDAVKDQVFVSDADEPFEAVSLKFEGGELPDEETFARLVDHPDPANARVQILDVAHWDARGEYKDLVDATRAATKGSDVMVYRIEREGARVEYFLVGVEGGKLLGAKALAVES